MVNISEILCNKWYDTNNVKYIVVHYTASAGGRAKAVANYFKTSNVSSSAHYVVDETDIVRCVPENKGAWHAGNSTYNKSSIGIEICCYKTSTKTLNASDKDWYFSEATLNNVLDLIDDLKKRYPNAKIIRHYDVTGKICPAPFVHDVQKYNEFLSHVNNKTRYGQSKTPSVPSTSTNNSSFLVRVTADALNIRKGPGTGYAISGTIRDKGVYTIVETIGTWGRLKSGAGWISLNYTKKI